MTDQFYIRVDFDTNTSTGQRFAQIVGDQLDESGIGMFEMGPISRDALDHAVVGFLDNPDIFTIQISRGEPDWD